MSRETAPWWLIWIAAFAYGFLGYLIGRVDGSDHVAEVACQQMGQAQGSWRDAKGRIECFAADPAPTDLTGKPLTEGK